MEYLDVTPQQIEVALRALKAVGLADGNLDPLERKLIAAAAKAMHVDVDVDALEPITPANVAEALPDAQARTRLVQALLITVTPSS